MGTSCLGGFSVMLIPKLLHTPIKISFFGPKTAKLFILAKYWHFWSIWSHGRPKKDANEVPRLVCGCGARVVSRKTPFYFRLYVILIYEWKAGIIVSCTISDAINAPPNKCFCERPIMRCGTEQYMYTIHKY